jgi:hypothetical protein
MAVVRPVSTGIFLGKTGPKVYANIVISRVFLESQGIRRRVHPANRNLEFISECVLQPYLSSKIDMEYDCLDQNEKGGLE